MDIQKYFYKLHESYSQEICHLRKHGTSLLQKIKLQEIKINQRKQQKLKPHLRQIKYLNAMIRKLVKISAFIETYKYFQIIQQPLINHQHFFHQLASNHYENMLKDIVLKIKHRNRINQSVDFTIR